ncbi:MAG: PEP-CTERM sorting domain-containing protein [Acetobacteraceae bacterium]
MFRAVCCGLALTATLFAASPAKATILITFPTPDAAVALPSPTDVISIFGSYTAPTGTAPFAAAPFTLSFSLPSEVQVQGPTGTVSNGSFSLGGISGAYANNGQITDFSGATAQLLASTDSGFGEINLNAPQFMVPTGLFSLSVLTFPSMFGYDSTTRTVALTLGTFALDSGQASYGLDPSIGNNAIGVNLSQPVPEPSTWALLLVGCLGLAVFARRRADPAGAPAIRKW